MRTKMYWSGIVFALLALMVPLAVRGQDDDQEKLKQHLVEVVATSENFAEWLAGFPNWQPNVSGPDDNNIWTIEFYTEAADDWLGYATIDADTDEIFESFAPKPLPPDVYQERYDKVYKLMLTDTKVLLRLGDPDLWDFYMDYNRYETTWDAYFYRGIKAILVKAYIDDMGNFSVQSISDPNQLSDDAALENARNQAINLAYSAPGIDTALDGQDNWTTYTEQQGGTRWSVSFVADGKELFYALVDIQANKVLAAQAGGQ